MSRTQTAGLVTFLALFLVSIGCAKPKEGDSCRKEGDSQCNGKTERFKCAGGKWFVQGCHGADGCEQHLTSTDCDNTLATAGEACLAGQVSCAVDAKHRLGCVGGTMTAVATCGGPQGCVVDKARGKLVCDTSVGAVSDPCEGSGHSGACAADKKGLLLCEDGKLVLGRRCLGARGCWIEGEGKNFNCDTSLAEVGDLCDGTGLACSLDGRSSLQCTNGRFVLHATCKAACAVEGDVIACR